MKSFLYTSLFLLMAVVMVGCTSTTSSSDSNPATELTIAVGETGSAHGYNILVEKLLDNYDGWDDIDEKDVVGPGADIEVKSPGSTSMMSMAEGGRSFLDIPEDGKETDYIKLVKVDAANQQVTVAVTKVSN